MCFYVRQEDFGFELGLPAPPYTIPLDRNFKRSRMYLPDFIIVLKHALYIVIRPFLAYIFFPEKKDVFTDRGHSPLINC